MVTLTSARISEPWLTGQSCQWWRRLALGTVRVGHVRTTHRR